MTSQSTSSNQPRKASEQPVAAAQVDTGARTETLTTPDVSGKVREILPAGAPEQAAATSGSAQRKAVPLTVTEKVELLLEHLPKDPDRAARIMKGQLTKNLEHRIDELESQLATASRGSNYSAMNDLLSQIRHFGDLLQQLAQIGFEYLKTLWLQFVHNLSV